MSHTTANSPTALALSLGPKKKSIRRQLPHGLHSLGVTKNLFLVELSIMGIIGYSLVSGE
jgi:hypothetical protein